MCVSRVNSYTEIQKRRSDWNEKKRERRGNLVFLFQKTNRIRKTKRNETKRKVKNKKSVSKGGGAFLYARVCKAKQRSEVEMLCGGGAWRGEETETQMGHSRDIMERRDGDKSQVSKEDADE